jgi:hypothetical protein
MAEFIVKSKQQTYYQVFTSYTIEFNGKEYTFLQKENSNEGSINWETDTSDISDEELEFIENAIWNEDYQVQSIEEEVSEPNEEDLEEPLMTVEQPTEIKEEKIIKEEEPKQEELPEGYIRNRGDDVLDPEDDMELPKDQLTEEESKALNVRK